MKRKLNKNQWLALAISLSAVAAVAYCAIPETVPDVAGIVIDVSTNKPVEGAYVMAVYNESGGTFLGHSGHWCVKTKGMYTGKDGAFRFPPEKSYRPEVHVIKPDYHSRVSGADTKWNPYRETWYGTIDYVPDPNLYLKPQDPAKPEWNLGGEECQRPKTKEDAVANIEFLRIELAEIIKYGDGMLIANTIRRQIQRLESGL